MAGDRTSCDFCSRTCPGRHSEEELHSNEEGCGGLPHLGGDCQPGQGDRGESQWVGERPNNRKVSTWHFVFEAALLTITLLSSHRNVQNANFLQFHFLAGLWKGNQSKVCLWRQIPTTKVPLCGSSVVFTPENGWRPYFVFTSCVPWFRSEDISI